jgi:general stress protein 26
MSKELTSKQIDLILENEVIIFATSDLNNQPRAIIVQPSRVEKNRIILSNIQMSKSIENIKNNSKCFVNAYLKNDSDKQIKITGIANVFESGDLFDEIKEFEETNNLPDTLKVHSIIVIDYTDIEITKE